MTDHRHSDPEQRHRDEGPHEEFEADLAANDPTAQLGTPADEEYVDELPEDLDPSFVGPHTFPNNNRRRIPASIYILAGLACIAVWVGAGESSPLVNGGILGAGIGLVLFGLYGMIAGWTLRVDESDALAKASGAAGFPVGHAAAQMAWRGWLSRPTWRILLYSAENPPKQRGIVLIDGISGEVEEWFAEENPEDWSGLDPKATATSSAG